jgi:hypothetical protein
MVEHGAVGLDRVARIWWPTPGLVHSRLGMVPAGPWVQQKWTLGRSFWGVGPMVPQGRPWPLPRSRRGGWPLGADSGKLERRELGRGGGVGDGRIFLSFGCHRQVLSGGGVGCIASGWGLQCGSVATGGGQH